MNWKLFITACVSTALVSFPQNIIGCGPDTDPYDYYTSFFHQDLPDAKGYRPFYYTGYNFLYDENEPVNLPDVLAKEWAGFCGAPVTESDAKVFVNKFAWKDLNNLYFHLEKNKPLTIPDSVKRNNMTGYFMKTKNLETLGYLMYAKQVEPFVTGGGDYWEAPKRDSMKMDKLIKNGFQLLNTAKQDFIKLRFTYQVLRLAHYSGRYKDVIEWYDKHAIYPENTSELKNCCLALKAGALFRTGQQKEAAYLFSKAYSSSVAKRISNYLGFKWSISSKTERNEYLQLCKNNQEKAGMLALFAMGSIENELAAMKEIYKLNPTAEELEVLAVREINKLEENYLTPSLSKQHGGKAFYLSWAEESSDSAITASGKETNALAEFFHTVAKDGKAKNTGLFENAAAYTSYMMKDYRNAKKYLVAAEKMNLSQKLKDQWSLTNLLVTINEKDKIDGAFEEQMLPSIQWLEGKATAEKPFVNGYSVIQQWKTFYRSLMSEILAKRYHEQNDLAKETLAIGTADWIISGKEYYYSGGNGIDFLRNKLQSDAVEKLYALLDSKQPNKFESYLIKHNAVKKTDVTDFAGTAYLREYDYAKAIEWFKKSADKKPITKNPFIELLYDQEEQLPAEKKFSTTKLAFAQEMLKLKQTTESNKNASAAYYKMALGLYNMTYYGHTWELVQYYRSGSDGYYIPKNANSFEKEYYSASSALQYFKIAMETSADKNFKAKCLFMMAKCAQKQLHRPQYDDYASDYDKMDAAEKKYLTDFKRSSYFPQLVKEYGTTPFYKEAFSRCSYLRDFVKRK